MNDLLPQFYASKYMHNIRLAAIFSIDVVKLQEMGYEERLHGWADNIIHLLGYAVDAFHYEAWKSHVSITSMDDNGTDRAGRIRARIFFNDVHAMAKRWGEYGINFLQDLFFWVWRKLENEEVWAWTQKEEASNSAPFEDAYSHEANHALKSENLAKGEAYTWIPSEKVLNRLSSNFGIMQASKSKRSVLKREFVSYIWDDSFHFVLPYNSSQLGKEWKPFKLREEAKPTPEAPKELSLSAGSKGSPSDRIRKKAIQTSDDNVDWNEIVKDGDDSSQASKRQKEDLPTSDTFVSPTKLNSSNKPPTPSGKEMHKAELMGDANADGENTDTSPGKVPFLLQSFLSQSNNKMMEKLVQNEAFRSQFLKLAEQSGHIEPITDDGGAKEEDMSEGREETNHTRSPSKAGNKLQLSQRDVESQAEGLKELTSSLLPMVAKSKTDIKLKDWH